MKKKDNPFLNGDVVLDPYPKTEGLKKRLKNGRDRTEPIKSITLDSFSVLSYRVMATYGKMEKDFGEYKFMVKVAMDILIRMPEEILSQLVKSDFLLDKKEVSK